MIWYKFNNMTKEEYKRVVRRDKLDRVNFFKSFVLVVYYCVSYLCKGNRRAVSVSRYEEVAGWTEKGSRREN